jgi:hypothetical protein
MCWTCDKDFSSQVALELHWKSDNLHHGWCFVCNVLVGTMDDLPVHYAREHFYCVMCNWVSTRVDISSFHFNHDYQVFPSAELRDSHLTQAHNHCLACNVPFPSPAELAAHSFIHQSSRPHSSFYQLPDPAPTPQLSSPEEAETAGIDPVFFALPRRLVIGNMYDKHRRISSNGTSVSSPVSINNSLPHRAVGVSQEPQRTYSWASHKSWNPRVRGFQCVLCDEHFRTLPLLNAHLSSPAHTSALWDVPHARGSEADFGQQNAGPAPPVIQMFHCPNKVCGKEFVTLNALCRHAENGTCRTSVPGKGEYRHRKDRKDASGSGKEASMMQLIPDANGATMVPGNGLQTIAVNA